MKPRKVTLVQLINWVLAENHNLDLDKAFDLFGNTGVVLPFSDKTDDEHLKQLHDYLEDKEKGVKNPRFYNLER
jgi:hypothetical protein